MGGNIEALCKSWLEAKRQEKEAQDNRRAIEDQLIEAFGVSPALDGSETHDLETIKVKVTGRITRKVDADKVQEIAAEIGAEAELMRLFRWKPEMIVGVWKNTDPTITTPFLNGITSIPGRPSFNITEK